MKTQTIAIAADHGGLILKDALVTYLKEKSAAFDIHDFGTKDTSSVDYPDFAEAVVDDILAGKSQVGILCCGTGIGMSIKANRYKGIRAAVVHDVYTAKMAKEHNNANILCLGARTTSPETAYTLIDTWLSAAYEGARHEKRIQKLDT